MINDPKRLQNHVHEGLLWSIEKIDKLIYLRDKDFSTLLFGFTTFVKFANENLGKLGFR